MRGAIFIFFLVVSFPSFSKVFALDAERPKAATYEEKIECIREDAKYLWAQLDYFKFTVGRYPTNEEGFEVLVAGSALPKPNNYSRWGYIKEELKDPWGRRYIYREGPLSIISYGLDGSPGGEGKSKDIVFTRK